MVTSLWAASSLWRDVRLVVGPYRPHTLIVGPSDETASFVAALREGFLAPVHILDAADVTTFPADARTIVLRNLDALDPRGQLLLMAKLERSTGALQVISLAEQPPFTRVQRGLLMESLYRRLSVIYLVIEGCERWEGRTTTNLQSAI